MRESIFRQIFGNSVRIKILDALISEQKGEIMSTPLAKHLSVTPAIVKKDLEYLYKLGLLKLIASPGRIKVYELDSQNLTIKALISFDLKLSKIYSEVTKNGI